MYRQATRMGDAATMLRTLRLKHTAKDAAMTLESELVAAQDACQQVCVCVYVSINILCIVFFSHTCGAHTKHSNSLYNAQQSTPRVSHALTDCG